MESILISACLLGEKVRYDGGGNLIADSRLARWLAEGRLKPICPEMAGGLPTPRDPAETQGGDGHAVWDGTASVMTVHGASVTEAFKSGAEHALILAQSARARMAILKARSPSCGSSQVYDGSFSGTRVVGQGVTAALLMRHDIRVFNEEQLDEAAAYLADLENATSV